jgi:hypothetical protein
LIKRRKTVKSVSIVRTRSTSTQRSRDTARRKRRPQPGTKGARHSDHHQASARSLSRACSNRFGQSAQPRSWS